MRGRDRHDDLALWAAVGLGVGFVAGFILAEAVGKVDGARVGRAVERLRRRDADGVRLAAEAAEAEVRAAFAALPALATLELEVVGLAPGRVELLGWVPDRLRRALAERTAAGVAGLTGVVNRLLVRDEDTDAELPALALSDTPA